MSLVKRPAWSRVSFVLAALLSAPAVAVVLPALPAQALQGTVQSTTSPMGQTNGQVDALAYANGLVFAGGAFTSARPPGASAGVSEQPRQSLAAFSSTTGALNAFRHTFNGAVKTIAPSPDGSRIYVGGTFTTVDGQARNRLAAFNTTTGGLISDWRPSAGSTVSALGVGPDGAVYVGGSFAAVSGLFRLRLAAVHGTSGAVLPWNATADATPYAIAVSSGKVFVGGTFERLNDDPRYRAVGTLDAVTGALVPFPAESVMPDRTDSCYSVVRDIVIAGGDAYFVAEGTGGGCFDGSFAARVGDGEVKWVNRCLGATQSVEVVGQWLYKGSHAHDCQSQNPDDPDGFPEVETNQSRHLLAQSLDNGRLGPWYPNTSGNPLGPRASATDGRQLFVAGDFRSVNGRTQQGVARFSSGPDTTPPARPTAPVAVSAAPGQVSVYVQSPVDQDDTDLTVRLYRDGGTVPIATKNVHSLYWRQPVVGFSDSGLAPGSTHTYRADAVQRFDTGVSPVSATTSVKVASSTASYAGVVSQDDPSLYWRLGELSGAIAADSTDNLRAGTFAGTRTPNVAGAVSGDGNTAVTFDGTGVAGLADKLPAPGAFSAEAWFKTTTTTGGKILGFGNSSTGSSNNYDKHVYMTNEGQLVFGVYNGGADVLITPATYNDGQYHHVVAAQGPSGMVLFVDGVRVARNGITTNQPYDGYWRIGGDNLNGWPSRPTSDTFTGTIDELAVYDSVLPLSRVVAHYAASGRTPPPSATPTDTYGRTVTNDEPTLYWRLGESGGPVAADASGNGDAGTYSTGITYRRPGAVAGLADTSVSTSGVEDGLVASSIRPGPAQYSAEAWFRTTTAQGGKLLGFGNTPSGNSSGYDKHVYMTDDGRLKFGVYTGATVSVTSPSAYNDGQWHHVVATQGPAGMVLYVDGVAVDSNAEPSNQGYDGHWRVGGDNIGGWPDQPTSAYFAGDVDEFAVYAGPLPPERVAAHHAAGQPAPPDTTAPTAPTVQATSDAAGTTVSVSWTASNDAVGVTGYQVLRDGTAVGGQTTGTSYEDTTVTPATTYSYAVRAVDAAGNSSESAPVSVTTGASPAPSPVLHAESWSGADGSPWPSPAWVTGSAAGGSATVQSGRGVLGLANSTGAWTRAMLGAAQPVADAEVLTSYSWDATTPTSYFSVYLRGSGGWQNQYRPRNGYGLSLSPNTGTVSLQKNVNGVQTVLQSVAGGQQVTTGPQWLRFRVTGDQVMFRTWASGQPEPTTWKATVTDASVTTPGQLFLAHVRGGSAAAAKALTLDDLQLSRS